MRALVVALASLAVLVPVRLGAQPSALGTLSGTIGDLVGAPVSGAEVYVYDSATTRRAATFISPTTGPDGRFELKLPAGTYWVVARKRQAGAGGPLGAADLRSGEALVLDLAAAGRQQVDFVVGPLADMVKRPFAGLAPMRALEGRVVDAAGRPLAGAYAVLWQATAAGDLLVAVSAWTDATGSFALQARPGTYLLAPLVTFPPGARPTDALAVTLAQDGAGVDLVLRSVPSPAPPSQGGDHD